MKTSFRTVLFLTAVCTLAFGCAVYASEAAEEPEITEEESRTLADLIQPASPTPASRTLELKTVPAVPTNSTPTEKVPEAKKPETTRTASLP